MLRHRLKCAHQSRVIGLPMPQGGAGVHPLLRASRLRQCKTQCSCALQREIQVFLVQRDTEAGIEGALDHALAMHFEDAPWDQFWFYSKSLHPAQPLNRGRLGLVLATHPAIVANRINVLEHPCIVDLTGARLVATGVVGDLDVADA